MFQRPFQRIIINNDNQLANLIIYIHRNPQKHGLVDDYRDWPYSSFGIVINDKPTFLRRDVVQELFGGDENIKIAHQKGKDLRSLHNHEWDNF